jgi:hypothetical protein
MVMLNALRGLALLGLVGLLATDCGGQSDSRGTAVRAGTGATPSGGATSIGGTGAESGGTGGRVATTGGTGGKRASGGAGRTALDECTQPSECTVVDVSCCASCQPTAADLVAINSSKTLEYFNQRACTDAICDPCNSDGLSDRTFFGASCDQGRCVVFDARQNALTECNVSDDCKLRAGLGCCEGCGGNPSFTVAVSKDADLESLVCGAPVPCPQCGQIFPSDFKADCVDGRCATVVVPR